MPGYVIADVTVTDPETYAGYRALTPDTIAAFDGRFLVRGGEHEVIEGPWTPGRLVLLQFDSPARAAAWYESPAYVEARAIRHQASTGNVVLLDGDGDARGEGSVYLVVCHAAVDLELVVAAAAGGRVLVAGGTLEIREGSWPGDSVSVLEFDSAAKARAWIRSDDSRRARAQVIGLAPIEAVLVEGV